MRRLKSFLILLMALGFLNNARAFSLHGPYEAWMVERIGYQLAGDIGGPMNIGEEYRWNVPILTYAYDESFLNYFGSNGVVAVEQAMAIMNRVPPLSTLSSNLVEYPLDVQRINLRASTLGLIDLKSTTLFHLMEEVGLAEAGRWIFTLRGRFVPAPGAVNYSVILRNFDPVTARPTSYLNGTLYTYDVGEVSVNPDVADAVERQVDPNASTFTSVASSIPFFGGYYTDLSRDDVGGLRYLYHPKNVNVEDLLPNTQIGETNLLGQILQTIDFGTFLAQARTNPPAALLALYPDLFIISTSSIPAVVTQTNFITIFTNYPWQPVGSPPVAVLVPVFTNVLITNFQYTFGNLVTNRFSTTGTITTRTINVVLDPFAPVGSTNLFVTNITVSTTIGSFPNGDFYILPTNVVQYIFITNQNQPFFTSDIRLAVPLVTNIVAITNMFLLSTNGSRRDIVTFQTNFLYAVHGIFPLTFTPATPGNSRGRRPGVDKLTFTKLNYDSLLGQTFVTVTNTYFYTSFSNTVPIVRQVRRLLTQPDILFLAEDIGVVGPSGAPFSVRRTDTTGWINNDDINGTGDLSGPGVIAPQVEIIYNKILPVLINSTPSFLDELSAFRSFIWGSFDGSTNPPVIYPEGAVSIIDLENTILRPPP